MDARVQDDLILKQKKNGILSRLFEQFTVKKGTKTEACAELNEFSAEELLDSIRNARNEWINANMDFEYVKDEELVDYYTYKIKASEVRYQFYLKKAKEKGLKVESLQMSLDRKS